MDFDFTTETITPDISSVLTIGGNGALVLPSGTTAQEPSAAAGAIRWNTSVPQLEFYSGLVWSSVVTSVSLNDLSTTPIYTTSPTTATTGAVAETITLNTQAANEVFAGPISGVAAQPTFRTLVFADLFRISMALIEMRV